MSDFIKIDIICNCDPWTLNIRRKHTLLPNEQVYIKINATETLENVSKDRVHIKIKKQLCWILIEIIDQIGLRFNASYSKPLMFLKPENAV